MSSGVNKVILVGNIGRDPDIRFLANGTPVVNVSVATNESWKDKQSGERKERTEWHKVVFFGKLAEIVDKYLTKGSTVYLEGGLRTRKWQDKNGADQYSTEIVASEMRMLGGRNQPKATATATATETAPADTSSRAPGPQPSVEYDDDIPF